MKAGVKILITCVCSIFSITAAKAQVEWLESEYDYGTFREAAGPQKGSVRFVNKGSEPTFISGVRPSCGCTAAAYTESMIQPGDTAIVSFIYNPYGRPGRFDKTVKVFTGKDREMKVVRIKGTVIGEPETLKTTYPYMAGPLRLERLTVPVGDIPKGSSRHLFLNVYNQSEDTISPSWSNHNRAVEVELTPKRLAPGDIGTLGFYLRTPLAEEMGPVEYPVEIVADASDPHSERKELTITANITPNPNEVAMMKSGESGHIFIPHDYVDLGEVGKSERRKFRFEIINDGKAPLDIARVYCLNDAVRLKGGACRIKPGKRKVIDGEVMASRLSGGPFRLNVEVVCNDPVNPVKTVRVVGICEK